MPKDEDIFLDLPGIVQAADRMLASDGSSGTSPPGPGTPRGASGAPLGPPCWPWARVTGFARDEAAEVVLCDAPQLDLYTSSHTHLLDRERGAGGNAHRATVRQRQ